MEPKHFLRNCVLVIITVSSMLILFNILMDPYLIFGVRRVIGFNARKPAVENQLFLMKAYDVLRVYPSTLILGSSSVGIGINSESPVWPDEMRPVYNLGVPDGRPLESYRFLQHAMIRHHPKMIVLGLGFRDFVPLSVTTRPEYDSRLLVTQEGTRNTTLGRQHVYDLLRATLSFDTSVDGVDALLGNLVGDSSDIDQGGWDFRPFRHRTFQVGSYPLIVLNDIGSSSLYADAKVDMSALRQVRAILDICREQQIKAIVVLDPSYVDELEIFDLAGKWPALEEWKRELTALAADYANRGTGVELWDFYGYDVYSTEPLPEGRGALRWFFNPAHYTHALGDIVLRRMFTGAESSFGVRLLPENIESHLQDVRDAQALYRESQHKDAQRIREIYGQATALHSR